VVLFQEGEFLLEGVEGEVVGVGGEGLQDVGELAEDVGEDGRGGTGGELDEQILHAVQVLLQRVDLDGEVKLQETVQHRVYFLELALEAVLKQGFVALVKCLPCLSHYKSNSNDFINCHRVIVAADANSSQITIADFLLPLLLRCFIVVVVLSLLVVISLLVVVAFGPVVSVVVVAFGFVITAFVLVLCLVLFLLLGLGLANGIPKLLLLVLLGLGKVLFLEEDLADVIALKGLLRDLLIMRNEIFILIVSQVLNIHQNDRVGLIVDAGEQPFEPLPALELNVDFVIEEILDCRYAHDNI
jgi:hypothetical protein